MKFRIFISISLLLFMTLISLQHPLPLVDVPGVPRGHSHVLAPNYNRKGDLLRVEKETAVNSIDQSNSIPEIVSVGSVEKHAEGRNEGLGTGRWDNVDRDQYYRSLNEEAKDLLPDMSLLQDNERGDECIIANDLSRSGKLNIANSLLSNRRARGNPKGIINPNSNQLRAKSSYKNDGNSFALPFLDNARRVRTISGKQELAGTNHFSEKTREAMRKMNPLTIGDQVAQMIHARKCGSKCKSVCKSALESSVAFQDNDQQSLSENEAESKLESCCGKQHSHGSRKHSCGKDYGFSVIILAGDPLKVKSNEAGKGKLTSVVDGKSDLDDSNENVKKYELNADNVEVESTPEMDKSNRNSMEVESSEPKSELGNEVNSEPGVLKYNVNSIKGEESVGKFEFKNEVNSSPEVEKSNVNSLKDELRGDKSEIDSTPKVENYKVNSKKDELNVAKPELKSVDDSTAEEDISNVNGVNYEFSAGNPQFTSGTLSRSDRDKTMESGVQDESITGGSESKNMDTIKSDLNSFRSNGMKNKYHTGLGEDNDKYSIRDFNKNRVKGEVNSGENIFKQITNRFDNSNNMKYLVRPGQSTFPDKTDGKSDFDDSNADGLRDEVYEDRSKFTVKNGDESYLGNVIVHGRKNKDERGQIKFTGKYEDPHFDQSIAKSLRNEARSKEITNSGKTKDLYHSDNANTNRLRYDERAEQSKFSEKTEDDSLADMLNRDDIKKEAQREQNKFSDKTERGMMSQLDNVKDEDRARQSQLISGAEDKSDPSNVNVDQRKFEFRVEKKPNAKIEFPIYDQDLVSAPDPFHGLLEQKYWATYESNEKITPVDHHVPIIHSHRISARGIWNEKKNKKIDTSVKNEKSSDENTIYRVITNAEDVEDGVKSNKKSLKKEKMAYHNRVVNNEADSKDDTKSRIKDWKKGNGKDVRRNGHVFNDAVDNKTNEDSGTNSLKKSDTASGGKQCGQPPSSDNSEGTNKTSNGTCRSWNDVSNGTDVDDGPSPLEPFSDMDIRKNESCCISWNDISPNYCEVTTNATTVCLPTEEVTPECGDDGGSSDVEEFEDLAKVNLNRTCCKSWKDPDNESNTITKVTTVKVS